MFLNHLAAEFSFFYTKRSSLDLYIQTYQEFRAASPSLGFPIRFAYDEQGLVLAKGGFS